LARELPYSRKQQLAAGLVRLATLAQWGKGLWLMWVLWQEPDNLQWVVITSHVGVGALAWLLTLAMKGRPLWGKLAIFAVLTIFLLLQLPKHPALDMDPPWNVLLTCWQFLPLLMALLALAFLLADPSSPFSRFKTGYPRLSRLLQILLVAGLTPSGTELALRQLGFQPGIVFQNHYLQPVDELRSFETYSTDENGIFALSDTARTCLHRILNGYDDPNVSKEWPENLYYGEDWILRDHLAILRGELKNGYTHYLDRIREQPVAQRDPVDQTYLDQVRNPINENGFRSIPFRNDSTSKKKVLMLGDSFTWGHSASHFSQSFSDLLILSGHAIYNAGISATDPAQYEAIAVKYIPIIRPDVVVVNLYMGNDIFYFRRPVVPYQTPLYLTNAGMILAHPGPEWLPTADSAYAFVDREQRIPQGNGLRWNGFCAKTALGTLVWRAMSAAKMIPFVRPNAAYWDRCAPLMNHSPVTGDHLKAIRAFATANGARFVLAVIPQYPEDTSDLVSRYPQVLYGMSPLIPNDLDAKDYTFRGGHFNDSGHRKFAAMLAAALHAPQQP
jgi:hypothetical protein